MSQALRQIIATLTITPLLRFLPRLPGNRKVLCKIDIGITHAEDYVQPKPLRVLKISDVSTSMGRSTNPLDPYDTSVPSKLAALKAALYELIGQLRSQDQLALLRFSSNCTIADDLLLNFTAAGAGTDPMYQAVDKLAISGATDFANPLRVALGLFQNAPRFDDYTNLVIFDTDGLDLGNKPEAVRLCEELRNMGVILYGCGFGVSNDGETHLSSMFGAQYAQLKSDTDVVDFHRLVFEDVQDALLTNARLVFMPVEYDAQGQGGQTTKQWATVEHFERIYKNNGTLYEAISALGRLPLGNLGLKDTYTVYAQFDFPVPVYAMTQNKGALGTIKLIADVPGYRNQTIGVEPVVLRFADNDVIVSQTPNLDVRQLKDDAIVARGGSLISTATSPAVINQQLLVIAATAAHVSNRMRANVGPLIERSRQAVTANNANAGDLSKLAREAATGAFSPESRRAQMAAAIQNRR